MLFGLWDSFFLRALEVLVGMFVTCLFCGFGCFDFVGNAVLSCLVISV